jgi:hypothetical protein
MKRNAINRQTFYWTATGVASLAVAAIGVADIVRAPAVIEGVTHLGYPAYFATILGVWKLFGVVAIVTPGHPRVKEWAYAGLFFVLTGAALSHAISGDPVPNVVVPLVLLAFVMISWALLEAGDVPRLFTRSPGRVTPS